jgi:hypothetical protein
MKAIPSDQDILNEVLMIYIDVLKKTNSSKYRKSATRNTVELIKNCLLSYGPSIKLQELNKEIFNYKKELNIKETNKDNSKLFNLESFNFTKQVNFLVDNDIMESRHKEAVVFCWLEGHKGAHSKISELDSVPEYADAMAICLYDFVIWFYNTFNKINENNKNLKIEIDNYYNVLKNGENTNKIEIDNYDNVLKNGENTNKIEIDNYDNVLKNGENTNKIEIDNYDKVLKNNKNNSLKIVFIILLAFLLGAGLSYILTSIKQNNENVESDKSTNLQLYSDTLNFSIADEEIKRKSDTLNNSNNLQNGMPVNDIQATKKSKVKIDSIYNQGNNSIKADDNSEITIGSSINEKN